MSFIIYLIIFIFVLGIIVLVHEFGHFVFARRAGILCHEFSIGMGPALYKTKKGETTYCIRAIPIGGYVSMAGEDPETDKIKKGQIIYLTFTKNKIKDIYLYKPTKITAAYAKAIDFDLYGKDGAKMYIHYEDENGLTHFADVADEAYYQFKEGADQQIAPYDRCFESKPWWGRFLTVVAGAGFNFLLALLLFIIINLIAGVPSNQPIIGLADANMPAAQSGLLPGDKIIAMNGQTINTWNDISKYMDGYTKTLLNNYSLGSTSDRTIQITVVRKNIQKNITVTPEIYIATIGIYSGTNLNKAVIGSVADNSNAEKKGLVAGDQILSITGTTNIDKNYKNSKSVTYTNQTISNWYDLQYYMSKFYLGETITLSVKDTDGIIKNVQIETIKALKPINTNDTLIGISPKTSFNFFDSIVSGLKQTGNVVGSIFQTLHLLFTDKNVSVSDLSGPVGIYDMTKTFAMAGILSLLSWVAFISANIGFVNLLPLPALDGGRLIFLIIEAVVRRPVNRKIEGYIHTVGFVLFMMLFVYITYNDILRIGG